MTRPTRVAIWKVLLPTLYSQADGCYCCHRRKHNSVTSLVCVVTLLMVRSAMIPRKVPQSSHKVFLKCGNSERSQQCPGCCLSVTELSPASVACRLNILDYHDLTPTLSRFSRYVWRAAGRRGPYAHICRGEPGGLSVHTVPVCRYLTQCRNPGKSKWRNRRRRSCPADKYWRLLLDDRLGAGPVHIADPGMWKWLTANQLNREIPFLQHLRSIVSVRCSLFQVTGECPGQDGSHSDISTRPVILSQSSAWLHLDWAMWAISILGIYQAHLHHHHTHWLLGAISQGVYVVQECVIKFYKFLKILSWRDRAYYLVKWIMKLVFVNIIIVILT